MADGNRKGMPVDDLVTAIGAKSFRTKSPTDIIRPLPTTRKSKLSQTEINAITDRIYVNPQSRDTSRSQLQQMGPKGLFSQFLPTHEFIGGLIRDSKRFEELCPEITEAASITVSSILSPTDLQQCNPGLIIDKDIEQLSEELESDVIEYLSTFFFNEFKLGTKLEDWVFEAKFRSGAKVLFVLPERVASSMYEQNLPEDQRVIKQGSESMNAFNRAKAKKPEAPKSFDQQWLDAANACPITGLTTGTEALKNYLKASETEITAGIETFVPDIFAQLASQYPKEYAVGNEVQYKEVKSGIESIAVKFVNELTNGNTLKIAESPDLLQFGQTSRRESQKSISQKLNAQYNQSAPFVSLLDYMYGADNKDKSIAHPLFLELPTEAVMPVCIPGSKSEHIGYFVLVDEYGYPLEAHQYLCDNMNSCSTNSAASAFSAMYGKDAPMTSSLNGTANKMLISGQQLSAPFDPRKSMLAEVFDYILDTMLKNRLRHMGLGKVDLGQLNTISACMLRRFFERKKTCIVFVPKDFITYFCFEYREDGTGHSKLEDVRTLIALRATLMVASLMSAINAAIPYRKFDITVDPKEKAVEQTIQEAINAIIFKSNNFLHVSTSEIMDMIRDQHISIVPKGINGLNDVTIEKSETTNSAMRFDDSLNDSLTKMIIMKLGVPASALNNTGADEYAKSVVSTNIFFANKTTKDQGIACDHSSDCVQKFTKYSPVLIQGILNILKSKPVKDQVEVTAVLNEDDRRMANSDAVTTTSVDTGAVAMTDNDDKDYMPILLEIIENLRITLPAPNIAAHRAQYDEAKSVMEMAMQHIDQIISREMVGADSELADIFAVVNASMKYEVGKTIMDNVGMSNLFNLTSLEDFLTVKMPEVRALYRKLRNAKGAFEDEKTLQTREPSSPDPDAEGNGEGDVGGADNDGMGGETPPGSPW